MEKSSQIQGTRPISPLDAAMKRFKCAWHYGAFPIAASDEMGHAGTTSLTIGWT